jgi:hypothetical protein
MPEHRTQSFELGRRRTLQELVQAPLVGAGFTVLEVFVVGAVRRRSKAGKAMPRIRNGFRHRHDEPALF